MVKIQYQKDNCEIVKTQKTYVAPNFRYLSQNVGIIDVLSQASNWQTGNFESGWFGNE